MARKTATAKGSPAQERALRRRRLADRVARWVVSAGGIAIIASVLAILVFIVLEVLPLLYPARVERAGEVTLAGGGAVRAVLGDEHRSHVATIDERGNLRVVRVTDGKQVAASALLPAAVAAGGPDAAGPVVLTGVALPPESKAFSAATSDGRVLLAPVSFGVSFSGDERQVVPELPAPVALELDPAHAALGAFAAQIDSDGAATAAAVLADGRLAVVRRGVETNAITGETTESLTRNEAAAPRGLVTLVLTHDQRTLYGGDAAGQLYWWSLADGQLGEHGEARSGGPVSALSLLLGGRSLVVGQADGTLSVWGLVAGEQEPGEEQEAAPRQLVRTHDLGKLPGPVTAIAPSQRDKGMLALGGGTLGLFHSTSEQELWSGPAPVAAPGALYYAPKADGALVAGDGKVAELAIKNPHPEVTLKSLFGKVWYEGAPRPEHVWQSTGGSDDFEPKLSLTPLLVGTLKGTFYSLLLAIPLGVLGAMYASQFLHPTYRRYVKPTIELMASLPSVVLGFLAGLWLAPRLEREMPGLILMVLVLPASILLFGTLWSALPKAWRERFRSGTEALLFAPVLAGAIALCLRLSEPFERLAFGGDFSAWLGSTTGLSFDQRNAVVVGLAMGFAVIPIIFAIAEDAFSNVPQHLVAGSLALGADRWQTVTRVVLPTASPGIFSAIMIGFGRAVGETMIVLMATGNTPITSWNPFNGFRTLSANIAVEIPEAPHGGTLYRTLFLAGLLLFVVTFLVNTVAELVRQRLRERYAHL